MKKLSKILVLALSLAVIASAFVFASAAEDAPFLVEGLHRENWSEAIDNADENTPVELLNNYNVQNGETVEVKQSVKINLNGYTMTGAADGAPLFEIYEEGVTLTIAGPGKIKLQGTLAEVNASGSKIVIDGTAPIEIVADSRDSVFVIGGDSKSMAELSGTVSYKTTKGGNLFELASGSVLNMYESSVKISAEGANRAACLAMLSSGASANLKEGASVVNTAGHIFTVSDTDISTPVSIKLEGASLVSDSADYGSIMDADGEYASFSARFSEISAGGYAFVAGDTVEDYTGSGYNKVYAKPTVSVSLVGTNYTVSNVSKNDATLFYGNITGVVSGGKLVLNGSNRISYRTRLWDGECGVIIKSGVKLNTLVNSSLAAPLTDSDGTAIYFDPNATDFQNFSLDTIDGKQCVMNAVDALDANNKVESYYIVGVPASTVIIDSSYSTNFQDVPLYTLNYKNDGGGAPHKVFTSARIDEGHSSVFVMDDANGNRYLKLDYDANSTDYSPTAPSGGPYFSLKLGYGALTTVPANRLQYNQDFITFDMDITSDTADANGNAVYYEGQWYLMQRLQGSGYSYHTSPHLKITKEGKLTCGNTNLLEKGGEITYDLPKTPGEWTHLTIILEIDNESAYAYKTNSYMHFYINGGYEGSMRIFNDSDWGLTDDKIKLLTSDEWRFTVPSSASGLTSRSTCYDNITQTFYPDGYTGDLNKIKTDKSINLSDLNDTVYTKGYVYPDGIKHTVEAKVDGVDYYSVDKAIEAIADDSVVELFADVEGVYNANNSFKLHTNGYKFEVTSSTHYINKTTDENGHTVYDIRPANNFLPIYWDIGVSYETKVPLGVIPEYTGAVPPAVVNDDGTQYRLIGWSYTEGSTVADDIRPVTKEDIDRGYIILYPVYDIGEVLVNFKDLDGEIISSAWVTIVDEAGHYIDVTLDELSAFNDGSSFGRYEVNSWLYQNFSTWAFEDPEMTKLGKESVNVVPVFGDYATTGVRQSYLITNLTKFTPRMFIELPGDDVTQEVNVLGVSLKPDGKYLTSKNVSFYEKEHIEVDLQELETTFSAVATEVTVYLHFEVDGVKYMQTVNLKLDEYFKTLLEKSGTDTEKTAIMNMFRMIHIVTTAQKGKHSELVESYLNDPEYAAYLTDLDLVKDIAESANYAGAYKSTYGNKTYKEFNQDHWEGLTDEENYIPGLKDFVDHIDWNFASNTLSIYMDLEKHPLISGGYNAASYPGLFVLGGIKLPGGGDIRCSNGGNTKIGLVTLSLAHSGYDSNNQYVFNAFSDIYFQMNGKKLPDGSWDRDPQIPGSINGFYARRGWNLPAQISHLADRIEAGESGIQEQYDMARAIFIAHQSMGELCSDSLTYTPFATSAN